MPAKVNFIIGRAGTGKTHSIYSHIARNEKAAKRSVLIVPDRATFETERSLSEYIGGGILYTSVLSFTTLARRVLTETGNRKTFLSSQGRQMLVRRIVDEASSELTAFSRVSKHRGFSKECDEIILKCKRFSITPDDLLSADNLPARLREKLSDFALIYRKTNEYTEGRYIDGEDLVNSLTERLPRSSAVGTDVFIDAPDMLNSQIIGIIKVLFSVAASVTITFRIDITGSAPDRRVFESDFDAYRKLTAIAGEMKCETNVIRMQDKMLHQTGALLLPGAIFLNSPMTEPLFMLFCFCAFYCLQKHKFILSAVFTALAGFTRSLGVVLAAAIFIEGVGTVVRNIRDGKKCGKQIIAVAAALVISTLGTVAYLLINYNVSGDFFIFMEYEKLNWDQQLGLFFDTMRYIWDWCVNAIPNGNISVIYSLWIPTVLIAFASLALITDRMRELPSAYIVFFLAYYVLAMGCTWLLSAVRYLCATLPLTASVAALCTTKKKTQAVYGCTCVLYVAFLCMYMLRLSIF